MLLDQSNVHQMLAAWATQSAQQRLVGRMVRIPLFYPGGASACAQVVSVSPDHAGCPYVSVLLTDGARHVVSVAEALERFTVIG